MSTPIPVYRGFVYLIGSERFGWYKIGLSKNANLRVHNLGVLLPFRVRVIAIWKVENPREAEKELHLKLAAYRINGEWFSLIRAQLESLIDIGPSRSSIVHPGEFVGFENIPIDIVKSGVSDERYQAIKAYRSAVQGYMEQNSLPDTKENKKVAHKAVRALFKERYAKIRVEESKVIQ